MVHDIEACQEGRQSHEVQTTNCFVVMLKATLIAVIIHMIMLLVQTEGQRREVSAALARALRGASDSQAELLATPPQSMREAPLTVKSDIRSERSGSVSEAEDDGQRLPGTPPFPSPSILPKYEAAGWSYQAFTGASQPSYMQCVTMTNNSLCKYIWLILLLCCNCSTELMYIFSPASPFRMCKACCLYQPAQAVTQGAMHKCP